MKVSVFSSHALSLLLDPLSGWTLNSHLSNSIIGQGKVISPGMVFKLSNTTTSNLRRVDAVQNRPLLLIWKSSTRVSQRPVTSVISWVKLRIHNANSWIAVRSNTRFQHRTVTHLYTAVQATKINRTASQDLEGIFLLNRNSNAGLDVQLFNLRVFFNVVEALRIHEIKKKGNKVCVWLQLGRFNNRNKSEDVQRKIYFFWSRKYIQQYNKYLTMRQWNKVLWPGSAGEEKVEKGAPKLLL